MIDFNNCPYVVVGAGISGAVMAERIASVLDERVVVLEKRGHIGGNCWSEPDPATGIEVHVYGSHIFHTSDKEVWEYMNRFCSFNSYRHKVLTRHGQRVFQLPINLATINDFYGLALTPSEAREFMRQETAREGIAEPANLEEKAVSLIGRPLYEAFIKGYTMKQWGTPPSELPASIITRLPVRFNYDCWYFDDPWQGVPLEGYGRLFQRMLDHKRIEVHCDVDFFELRERIPSNCTIFYTGPIDRYFEYRHGVLNWRTQDFEREVLPVADAQGTAVMNYAESTVPYTRCHEYRYYHPERHYPDDRTVLHREYSRKAGKNDDPYYPVNTEMDRIMLAKYEADAAREKNVIFGGRLGTYRYLDMDKAVRQALDAFGQPQIR